MLAPAALVTAIVGLSLVHPWGDLRGVDSSGEILGGAVIPANVRSMIETKCADIAIRTGRTGPSTAGLHLPPG